jgi:hypothetical protein
METIDVKLTKEQLQHYLKGGLFKAIYQPTRVNNLNQDAIRTIGSTIEVYQNCDISPIVGSRYDGQHRFNTEFIYGWIPKEDIQIIELIDEFVENPESLPLYMFRMTYRNPDTIIKNFGKGNWLPSLVVGRSYKTDMTDYVLKTLSDPPADIVEKCIWDGGELIWCDLSNL